jgi:hypothetical protein
MEYKHLNKHVELFINYLKSELSYFELPKELRKELIEHRFIKKNGELDKLGESIKRLVDGPSEEEIEAARNKRSHLDAEMEMLGFTGK